MANHEWGSWGWTAEHLRTLGEGLVGIGIFVAIISVIPGDVKSPKSADIDNTLRIWGGGTSLVGGILYLLGKVGQKEDHF